MPSQFSAIGFRVSTPESLSSLASHVADRATSLAVPQGHYLKWAPASGEQLWLQLTPKGDAMGMTPHFAGRSRMRAEVEMSLRREGQTPLDGSFLAWLNPDASGDRRTPFVFDCPDAATHGGRSLPVVTDLQVAAFAQSITVFRDEDAYVEDQRRQGLSFPLCHIIPSGLVTPSGEPVMPPEPHVLMSGVVREASTRTNAVTGDPFHAASVETLGGSLDLVVDPELLTTPLTPGAVVSAWCWMSGRFADGESSPDAGRPWWRAWRRN